MGGLSSLATTAIQALEVANSVIGTIDGYQDRSGNRQYEQIKAQNNVALQNAAENAALQREQIRLSAEQADGRTLTIKKTDVSANAVTVTEYGGSGPDGYAQALSTQYKAITVASNGSQWYIVSKF